MKTTNNSSFNSELYQEMLEDNGCQYDSNIKQEMYDNMMQDYL